MLLRVSANALFFFAVRVPPTKVGMYPAFCLRRTLRKRQVHSFTCGFTIGAAFLGCGSTMGWSIFASTIVHEVPSEMADFIALLNGGMSIKQVCLVWGVAWLIGRPAVVSERSSFL